MHKIIIVDSNRKTKHWFSAVPVLVAPSCAPDQFECSAPSDGCIPVEKVYDGKVDCPTDEDDENNETRLMMAHRRFTEGE